MAERVNFLVCNFKNKFNFFLKKKSKLGAKIPTEGETKVTSHCPPSISESSPVLCYHTAFLLSTHPPPPPFPAPEQTHLAPCPQVFWLGN